MATPLLQTKLFVPRRRSNVVQRPRLIERLNRGLEAKLTLISAPAGFGKTTVLADWLASRQDVPVAWLSLDEGDNSTAIFWAYVIAALEAAWPGVARNTSELLQSPQPPPMDSVLATLINELGALPGETVLVLDDYHVIDDVEVQSGMTFLLDHLPRQLHIVIASRADPPLPLARLRARGELVELRAAELRFQAEEASSYITGAMGLEVSSRDIEALEARTEGWIAALQLAALSMRGREDVSAFVADFAGDDRYIVDYLVQEVLQRQPEEVRRFLLGTAILDRLTGSLCDAVTGGKDGQATLEMLERGNVFVVPLDERRQWYRYHHLFADVLRMHLLAEEPALAPELHRRASDWFEANGERGEAIRHALAAGDFSRVADLVELALPDLLRSRQEVTLRRWLEALPDDLLRRRPVLSAGYAGALMHSSEFGGVEDRLRDAERGLETATLAGSGEPVAPDVAVYVDEEQFRELPGMIALYRGGLSQVAGKLTDTVKYARLALEVMPEGAPLRGGAMALLGLSLWATGELDEAYRTYAEGIALVHAGGYVHDSSALMLADMRVAQGSLRQALGTYQHALRQAEEQGKGAPRGVADLHVGISELYREMDELDVATEHLARSKELGEWAGLPENRYRWYTAMAWVKQAQGEFDDALELLEQAERLYVPGFSPDVRPIASVRARVWIAQGRLTEAVAWAQEHGVTPEDEVTYLREFDHVTLARLLLAQAKSASDPHLGQASALLGRLLSDAEAGGRVGAVIEVLVLQALTLKAVGDAAGGIVPLQRALSLAEPEGYVRVFVDEGAPMAELLTMAQQQGGAPAYAGRLLAALTSNAAPAAARQPGPDALSEREVEVLRLLASDLSGPDIARELVVSLNTLRTHTKNIYTKLGATNRREALRRAGELGLI